MKTGEKSPTNMVISPRNSWGMSWEKSPTNMMEILAFQVLPGGAETWRFFWPFPIGEICWVFPGGLPQGHVFVKSLNSENDDQPGYVALNSVISR